MSLRDKQSKFVPMIAKLITYAYMRGYELTFGDAYRDPKVFGIVGEKKGYGNKSSNHKNRLAVDLNLFVHGRYITDGDHEAYKDLGEYWERIGGTWGGNFDDANHFSLQHNGMR